MGLEVVMLSKISHKRKDKHYMFSLICAKKKLYLIEEQSEILVRRGWERHVNGDKNVK
jgi:hypothetical protein